MKRLITAILAAMMLLLLCPAAFASGQPDVGEDVTIQTAEPVHPSADWTWQAQSPDGTQTYKILRAIYHGNEITLTADGYDGSGSIVIWRGENSDSGAASGEASAGFDFAALFASLEAGGSMELPAMGDSEPDPAIVEQFEKRELDPFEYVNDAGEAISREFMCYVYVPEEAATQSLPIVFCLNGIGECGTDGSNLTANRMATCWIDPAWQAEHPCIVVAPQIPEPLADQMTIAIYHDRMDAFVERLKPVFDSFLEEFQPSAVYLTGLSMGGSTSLYFMAANPDYPINAAILCCGPENELDATNVTDIPILFAQDMSDFIVDPAMSFDTYNRMTEAGNDDITLVVSYMNYGHFIWDHIYDNPQFMEWLFAK